MILERVVHFCDWICAKEVDMKYVVLGLVIGLVIGGTGGWFAALIMHTHSDQYEVIERSQHDEPNFRAEGVHTAVNYVLLNDGHKIWASCDLTTLDKLDPSASCAFRPLKSYACRPGNQHGDKALSDLLCQDSDGRNVYLYVSKKE